MSALPERVAAVADAISTAATSSMTGNFLMGNPNVSVLNNEVKQNNNNSARVPA